MNKDLLGNEVKTGDVMLELGRGYGCLSGSDYTYTLKLWEMPDNFDGHAYAYGIDGSKHTYAWAYLKNSVKVDFNLTPEGFEYSFKHGMSDFSSKIKTGTLAELIESSNWKNHEVRKDQVERFEFMESLEINSIDDIRNNISELSKGGFIPHKIISRVLELTRVGRCKVNNGEIGIASMYDSMNYQHVISLISDEISKEASDE